MPKGVEHHFLSPWTADRDAMSVQNSVMPKGVEHWTQSPCPQRLRTPPVQKSVMPKGVEYTSDSGSRELRRRRQW